MALLGGVTVALAIGLAAVTQTAEASFVRATVSNGNLYQAATLAPPTGLAANRSVPGQTTLTWTPTASTWATGYEVWRSTTSGCCYSLLTTVAGQGSTSYVDSVGGGGSAPTFVSVSNGALSSDGTSLGVFRPTGVTAGDLLIAHVSTDNANTFSAPSGWTLLAALQTGGVGDVSAGYFYKVAGGSEPSSYTFTWGSAELATASVAAYRGVDTTNPIVVSSFVTGDSSTPTAPSVTTTTGNAGVLRSFTADDRSLPSPTSNVYPSGTTGRYAFQSPSGTGVTTGGADSVQVAAGATGTASFTLSGGQRWIAATIALRPLTITYYYVLASRYLGWSSGFTSQV